MKLIILLIGSTFYLSSYAEQIAKVHYFENYPNNRQKIVFKSEKSCKSDPNFMQIREFFSEKKYTAVDTGKKEPVRIVHIHVNSSLDHCKDATTTPAEKTFDIPKSKMMTHVYVISDPTIQVNSLQ